MPSFITRPPTKDELLKFNLMISTATDGTGKMRTKNGTTYPDYAIVEDTTAEAFNGR